MYKSKLLRPAKRVVVENDLKKIFGPYDVIFSFPENLQNQFIDIFHVSANGHKIYAEQICKEIKSQDLSRTL